MSGAFAVRGIYYVINTELIDVIRSQKHTVVQIRFLFYISSLADPKKIAYHYPLGILEIAWTNFKIFLLYI